MPYKMPRTRAVGRKIISLIHSLKKLRSCRLSIRSDRRKATCKIFPVPGCSCIYQRFLERTFSMSFSGLISSQSMSPQDRISASGTDLAVSSTCVKDNVGPRSAPLCVLGWIQDDCFFRCSTAPFNKTHRAGRAIKIDPHR